MLKKNIPIQVVMPGVVGVTLGLLYFQITGWNIPFLGWLSFVLYSFSVGWWWMGILHHTFGYKRNTTTALLGVFAAFTILGLLSGMWAVWYRLTPLTIWISYLETAVVSFCFFERLRRTPRCHTKSLQEYSLLSHGKTRFRTPSVFVLVYLAGWMWAFISLFQFETQASLLSPWLHIPQAYLFLFFGLTLLLGFFLFSQLKIKILLVLVVLHSVLLHMYLPASHVLPWGGDVWRMLAVENKLMQGESHPPVLFGDEAKWRQVGSVSLPEALVIPHKYFYGQLWGGTILIAKTIGVDLIQLNRWLIPMLWSVFFPLLLFRIGTLLFANQRWGVWLAALSLLPFPLQVLGSMTLGVSLGYLTFLFALLLFLHLIRDGHGPQRGVIFFFALFMIFGYTLFFLLFWFMLLSYLVYLQIIKIQSVPIRRVLIGTVLLLSISIFPMFEVFSGTSSLPQTVDLLKGARQAVGQFSGWFYATQIRPHDISSGNIIFNHTPLVAFVPSIFANWRWHIMAMMGLLAVGGVIGLWRVPTKRRATVTHLTLATSVVSVWGGYIMSWFFLEGERSFARRLDGVLAFFLLVFFLYGVKFLVHRFNLSQLTRSALVVGAIIFFSWTTMTTYASGPDLRVMSLSEYDAAAYVWNEIERGGSEACVLADTWPLLGVEAASSGRLVGGGFPITSVFAQPERVLLYQKLVQGDASVVEDLKMQRQNTAGCWMIAPKQAGVPSSIQSAQYRDFGDIHAFFLPLKSTPE